MVHQKIAISLPEEVLAAVIQEAKDTSSSRSRVIANVLERYFYDEETKRMHKEIADSLAEETDEDRRERETWLAFGRRQARKRIEAGEW